MTTIKMLTFCNKNKGLRPNQLERSEINGLKLFSYLLNNQLDLNGSSFLNFFR